MQTDRIRLSGDEEGRREALEQVQKFSEYVGLSKKESLRVQLLAEETLGMMESVAGAFTADFYLESSENKCCMIHLIARTVMDANKKQELIDASTNRKNSARKGFMGKIRDIIENGLYSMDEVGSLQTQYGAGTVMYGTMGMIDPEAMNAGAAAYAWSLEHYRKSLGEDNNRKELEEARDELEKSIVAKIADEVKVSVKGDVAELTIVKKFR